MKTKRMISVLLLLSCTAATFVHGSKTAYEILEEQYLVKFSSHEKDSVQFEDAPPAENWVEQSVGEKLSPRRKRELLLHSLFPECTKAGKIPDLFQTDIWRDMQVFNQDRYHHLYDALFPGTSLLGEVYGACHLVTGSTDDIRTLRKRKNAIRNFSREYPVENLSEKLNELAGYLDPVVRLFDSRHPFYHYFNSEFIFSDEGSNLLISQLDQILPPEFIEEHKRSVLGANIKGSLQYPVVMAYGSLILLPIVSFLQIYLSSASRNSELTSSEGILRRGGEALAMIGSYGLLLSTPLTLLSTVRNVFDVHENLKKMSRVITSELLALRPTFELLAELANNFHILAITDDEKALLGILNEHLDYLTNENQGDFFHINLAHASGALRVTVLLHNFLIRSLKRLSRLDFLLSVSRQMESADSPYTFVDFNNNSPGTPYLLAKEMKNPLLDPQVAVSSDIKLGGGEVNNVILTGVNASGKSTLLRSLGINAAFLAQVLGIAVAKKFELNPYSQINSLMEKNDELGRSSFETEADSVAQVLMNASERSSKKGEKSRELVLADELLRTTNPQEAAIGSYIIAEEFGRMQHVSLILATHLDLLKTLSIKHPKQFVNRHMQVLQGADGEPPVMTYKFVGGASQTTNTLHLLEKMIMDRHPELHRFLEFD